MRLLASGQWSRWMNPEGLWRITVPADFQTFRVQMEPGTQAAPETPPVRRPSLPDFLWPLVTVIAFGLFGWWLWQRYRQSPTRGLRGAVRRAQQMNDQMSDQPMPHPVPEMRHEEPTSEPEATPFDSETTARRLTVRRAPTLAPPETREEAPSPELDEIDARAMAKLEQLQEQVDMKNPLTDYHRLEAFVRRYLYERYGVKAFGVSVATLLDSLPQDLTEGAVDYAGEILRVCEMAYLPRFRPSRGTLNHLYALAAGMVTNHARVTARLHRRTPDDGTSASR